MDPVNSFPVLDYLSNIPDNSINRKTYLVSFRYVTNLQMFLISSLP